LLTGVLRNLKKSKLKTTIHHLVVGDLGNNANLYHPTYFTTIEEAFVCLGKEYKYRDKKKVRCYGIKFHLECNK
jgi:hypothetical protein